MFKCLLFSLLLSNTPVDTVQFYHPEKILEQAAEYEAEGNYEKAIDLYLKISENDTSYLQIQASLLSAYNATKQYEKTIAIGTKLIKQRSKYRKNFYIDTGNAYLDSDQNEKAKEVYTEGLEIFPYDYILLYDMGLALRKLGDLQEAQSYFQRSASINPFFGNNHIMLGYLSMLQGHTSKAMLSYMTYLAINPDRNSTLVFLENLAAEAVRTEGSIPAFTDNSAFQQYDELIRSKAALDDRFKSEVEFKAVIVNQAQLLFSKLEYDASSEDFWMKFYVPFYKEMEKQDLHIAFIYYILKSANNENISSWLEKHTKEQNAWIDIANESFGKSRLRNPAEILGEKGMYNFWYYDNNLLSAIGNQVSDEIRTGPWAFFYDNNQINATGRYNTEGQKTGEWLFYYENGALSRREYYENNIITEPIKYFHENGALSIYAELNEKEELDGKLEYFYSCGQMRESVPYVTGDKEGNGKQFFETGEVLAEYEIKNNELDGNYVTYFQNGNIEKKYTNHQGQTNGKYQSFFINGQLNEEGIYENDLMVGDWIGYHPNGELMYKGTMTEGNRVGKWTNYYPNGNIEEETEYNDQGQAQGINTNYTEDGILRSELTYVEDRLIGLKYYNTHGEVIYDILDSTGNFNYETFYESGDLMAKGTLKDGMLNGPLSQYHRNGNIKLQVDTEDNNYKGELVEYYTTGEIYVKSSYEDGLRNGRYIQYYKNGQINHIGWYVDDVPEQWWITYHPDGSLAETTYFISGKMNGWNTYYAPGNKKQRAYKYELDMLVGLQQYDSTGNIYHELEIPRSNGLQARINMAGDTIFKVKMQCGKINSVISAFYGNNKPEAIDPIVDGLYEGTYEQRSPDGTILVKGQYKNNMQEGHWQWFYSDGKLKTEQNFIYGMIEGQLTRYYTNGNLESKCTYYQGELNGTCEYFDQYGNRQLTKFYKKDIGHVAYVDAKSGDTIVFDPKGEYVLKSYFKNGKLAVQQSYKDGKYHGENTWYNNDGQIVEKSQYLNGEYHGEYVQYYSNGNVYISTPYQYDNRNGLEIEYYENGKKRRETPYINNGKNGYETIYNQDGSIMSKIFYWNDIVY